MLKFMSNMFDVAFHFSIISLGIHHSGMQAYSYLCIGLFRKKFFMSIDMNLALSIEIVLLKINFASVKPAAGELASCGYSNLSPPTVILT